MPTQGAALKGPFGGRATANLKSFAHRLFVSYSLAPPVARWIRRRDPAALAVLPGGEWKRSEGAFDSWVTIKAVAAGGATSGTVSAKKGLTRSRRADLHVSAEMT